MTESNLVLAVTDPSLSLISEGLLVSGFTIINRVKRSEIVADIKKLSVSLLLLAGSHRNNLLIRYLRSTLDRCPTIIAIRPNNGDDLLIQNADLVFSHDDPYLLANITSVLRPMLPNRNSKTPAVPSHKITTQSSDIELLKEMIVKTVSHELRTPLLQVKSAITLLRDSEQDRERLISYAMESTTRLENVVMNITRLAESMDISFEPVLVTDIVAYAVRHLKRSWEYRDKMDRIDFQVETILSPVLADKQAIGTVLQLLIDNALKFSQDKVVVAVRSMNRGVEFRVIDRGIGIPPSQRKAIFESFYQVDHESDRRFGGLGIGLAIVRLILERHNIEIHLASQPGEGSTFSFILPIFPNTQ